MTRINITKSTVKIFAIITYILIGIYVITDLTFDSYNNGYWQGLKDCSLRIHGGDYDKN